ncbi:4-amino-4-deoxy-L-arabinose-phospho-UDP flippase subunit F [Leucothrix mucor]|uniref:4-amino-4-deoxy-L-arabinose-phospho-UDP flippase subunit F n=1 Tax=Leucothrix mucor TaxID=45248 RepID=UPI0003B47361|nr:4-amino-4-deoxy-L-arabinose-phospho-UDP flippase subunit F [Leucothrix mucor]
MSVSEDGRIKPRSWIILGVAILLTAVGQLFMKLSTQYLSGWSELWQQLTEYSLTSGNQTALLWFSLGILSYFVSMLMWVYVLSFLKLSKAYPLFSIAYVLVYVGAVCLPQFNETTNLQKNIGILIIIIGVVIVSLPSSRERVMRTSNK